MIHIREGQKQPVGLVMIDGIVDGDEDGPWLMYKFKQGFIWLNNYIKLGKVTDADDFKLVRMPDCIKDD